MTELPTERLTIDLRPIEDDEERRTYANAQCDAFAAHLAVTGQRPWFEVWYLGIRDPATGELRDTTESDFDAVEYFAGVPHTLPPYPKGWTR